MKGSPKRKEAESLDVSAALENANALTKITAGKQERPENEDTKLVSIRIKETDYKKLKGRYGSAGLSLSAGLKMSAFWVDDMIEQGALTLSAGGIIDRRK